MNKTSNVLFSDALEKALKVVLTQGSLLAKEFTLVRDLRGRIRVVIPSRPACVEQLDSFQHSLSANLSEYGFGKGRAVLFSDELSDSEHLFKERRLLHDDKDNLKVYLLDRQIIGQDWMRSIMERKSSNPRVTFYGIKGGVGRSTALVNWAWHLAKQGKKVLVFDLDLESPGVSSSLLPLSHLPDYGVVDWFVEDGVGQASIIESEMMGISPLAKGLPGEIKVIPAYGSKTVEYLPKLTRCYSDFSADNSMSWAERLQKMVEHFELAEKPDVVIFDSRAGLHDIAAVLATRMDADTLLFAIDTPQTWSGYSLLFKHWNKHSQVNIFRGKLQFIASMVPETGRDNYLQNFKVQGWDLFRDHLYDETRPDEVNTFSFDLDDEDAPHGGIPVFWHRALQEFNPVIGGIDTKTAAEAYGIFFEQADRLLVTSGKTE